MSAAHSEYVARTAALATAANPGEPDRCASLNGSLAHVLRMSPPPLNKTRPRSHFVQLTPRDPLVVRSSVLRCSEGNWLVTGRPTGPAGKLVGSTVPETMPLGRGPRRSQERGSMYRVVCSGGRHRPADRTTGTLFGS